jgi:hypothetical protein
VWAVRGDRRNDRFDARTVGKAALEDRAFLGQILADVLRKVAERGHQGLAGGEAGLGELESATSFDIDPVGPVDHDLADGGVVQESGDRLEELQDGLLEDRAGDHRLPLVSLARAASARGP